MRFKIDWASLIVGSKFTVFALFYFVFEGNFPSTSPEGLIHGGAYFRNFRYHFSLLFCRPKYFSTGSDGDYHTSCQNRVFYNNRNDNIKRTEK